MSYGLMSLMKARGHKVEFVAEYAKELTYRRDFKTLDNQFDVMREQDRRLRDLIGHVDFIVHDSALPLGLLYAKSPFNQKWFEDWTWELYESYRNFTIFVERAKAYETYGRKETEAQALEIDRRTIKIFGPERINLTLPGREGNDREAYTALMDFVR